MDDNCIKLAELCSQAVDYPKNGIPVNIDTSPRLLIQYKPDWHAAEVAAPRRTDYYDSDRALGHLYRAIEIEDPAALRSDGSSSHLSQTTLEDSISVALKPRVLRELQSYTDVGGVVNEMTRKLFQFYVDELHYICITHTVSIASDDRLEEEEVVVGTILAKCSQRRWRKDRTYRMQTHSQVLVHDVQREMINSLDDASTLDIQQGLMKGWTAWNFSLHHSGDFGANSFGLIALGVIFDCLEKLEVRRGYEEQSLE
jgi:RNA-dependent RNA polymerase